MESDILWHRLGGYKDGHGSTQDARSANKLMNLWSPAGEFAYMSKEIPVITLFFFFSASVFAVFYTPQGKFSPMAKNRLREASSSRWSECLN